MVTSDPREQLEWSNAVNKALLESQERVCRENAELKQRVAELERENAACRDVLAQLVTELGASLYVSDALPDDYEVVLTGRLTAGEIRAMRAALAGRGGKHG